MLFVSAYRQRRVCMLLRTERVGLLLLSLLIFLFTGTSFAQVTASMSGTVKDSTGAVIPDATVTVKHTETGLTRTAQTDANGSFSIPSIPVGQYEVTFEKPGFKTQVRQGINLVVGQPGVVNVAMDVGNVEPHVTVPAGAPLVNTTTSSTSGVVTEEQVKDLPLNGRSFDQLLTLNAHTNNYTTNDSRPAFSVAGKRVETNIFLINGVEYIGSDSTGQHVLPTGSSNSLLGVDAIREFNVQSEAYGAEYGKRAGAQVSIVTSSGTNQLHGDIFEFLRNTDLDAESFFFKPAPGVLPDVLKRNQFGGALGGPLVRDKMFLFGSYEGVRQRRATSQTANVPDAQARLGLLPNASGQYAPVTNLDTRMLPLVQIAWPDPNTWPGGCSEVFTISGLPTGVCNVVVNPLSSVREDFGVVRYDYNLSSKDSFSLNALYDNGITVSAGTLPFAGSEAALRSAVYSLQETRIFSPTVLNTFTFGLTRALADNTPTPYALFNGPKPPIPALAYFINAPDQAPGQIAVGGGTSGAAGTNSTITSGLGSSSRRLVNVRNLFTYADDVHLTKGRHNFSIGARFQRVQQNASGTPANGAGQATFSNETTLLQGIVGTFLAVPQTTWLYWHSTEGGIYAQDEIKLKPNLTVRLGLRDEFTNGMNEAHGRAAQYLYTNGVINTLPTVTPQVFTVNNAKSLWQPRVGIAWDPSGNGKWSVRAGFGMYNDLLDNLAHRLDSTNPPNTRLGVTNQPFFGLFPIDGTKPLRPLCTTTPPPPAAANICVVPAPGGIEPTAHTPTVQQWNLSIERQLSSNLVLHLGYTGMEAFHTVVLEDSNFGNFPAICNNAAGCRSGGANTTGIGVGVVPQGTYYLPLQVDANGTPTGCRINCDIADPQTWFYNGTMNYQGLDIYVQQRFSHGVTY